VVLGTNVHLLENYTSDELDLRDNVQRKLLELGKEETKGEQKRRKMGVWEVRENE